MSMTEEAVLKIHAKGKPLKRILILKKLLKGTPGFSGADIANVANEAALLAAATTKQKSHNQIFWKLLKKCY
jgi:cell division protease FtsH